MADDTEMEETDPFLATNTNKNKHLVVNANTEDEFSIAGYKRNICYTILFYIFGVLSIGLFFLLGYWYPIKRMKFTHDKTNLNEATVLLIFEKEEKQYYLSEIQQLTCVENTVETRKLLDGEKSLLFDKNSRYFVHKFLRYFFHGNMCGVSELSGLDNLLTVKNIYELSQGNSKHLRIKKLYLYGDNFINVPAKPFYRIFFELALNPFYIFQVLSVTLWYMDNYQYYASVIVAMTLASLIFNTYETYTHLVKLQKMVGQATQVEILQEHNGSSDVVTKSSRDLVPGDLLVIPPEGMNLPCDAVLLNGRCVVNESTLTGESFPTTKTALDGMMSSNDVMYELYSVSKHKRHTLYNGTEILQGHFYGGDSRILAVVMRTGFCTLKGRLIRSIIHPKPVHFTFFRDSMRFILFLFGLAFLGFIYTVYTFVKHDATPWVIVKKALDVFTIAVPPALPACMSAGLMYTLHRLRQNSIYCIDPARVSLCGKIKLFVFDKTGTLTEDRLAVSGVVCINGNKTQQVERNVEKLRGEDVLKGMACCHSLTIIKNELTGDPLDMYMFDFTKWNFNESSDEQGSKFELLTPTTVSPPSLKSTPNMDETNVDNNNDEIAILKQYPFESSLQRMSVITKNLHDKNMVAYVKGSPEMIMSMCRPDSVPQNIQDVLLDFTKTGSRVLAIATKVLNETKWHNIKNLQRSEIECDLTLLGLIVFENVLKPVSTEVIQSLQASNISTLMATGDNIYTATSVARQVNIIKDYQKAVLLDVNEDVLCYKSLQEADVKISSSPTVETFVNFDSLPYSLVLSGSTYIVIKEKFPTMLETILLSASVFARMSPDQKTTLVEDLKRLGYGVGMCGDGANDCGALKAAHAGIALSDTEASVAAPFTSKIFDISCVPKLLCEGQAALVTSFSIFKYMALYSFIQFMGVLILYSVRSNYSDFGFLYADLFVALPLCFAMVKSKASDKLSSRRPLGRLVHPIFVGGIFLQVFIQFSFQFGAFIYVRQMPWYRPPDSFKENEGEEILFMSYENAVVMIISYFQYIWLSVVCVDARPYRMPVYKNWLYMITFSFIVIATLIITFYQRGIVNSVLLMATLPSTMFCASLLLVSIGNLYVSFVVEKILLPSSVAKKLSRKIQGKTQPRNRYKHIYKDLISDETWPPVLYQ